MGPPKRTFLHDAADFVALGSHSLRGDDFSDCFKPVSPLAREKASFLYVLSFLVRYFIFFPLRVLVFSIGILIVTLLFLYGRYFGKYAMMQDCFIFFIKFMIILLNCKVTHVGKKEVQKEPHVYVSNHTSFIDYVVLSSHKFIHSCISEDHSGLFGFILKNILSQNGSIGFKRTDKRDKAEVLAKVKHQVLEMRTPMLVFPEGTCVNNESIVMFQKGVFELGVKVFPVGIRYSKRVIDPYWNRRAHGFTMHLMYLFTRWGMDAEVHWMPPMMREPGEDAIVFGHRVKNAIAKEMGLRNTIWNGYFKSSPMMNDREVMKECFQIVYKDIKEERLEKKKESDIKNGRFYLLDENINNQCENSNIYFGKVSYRKFINECCKEYLRMKHCRSEGKVQDQNN